MTFRASFFYVSIAILLLPLGYSIYAKDNTRNEVYIEVKNIDYLNYLVTANLKITVVLDKNNGEGESYAYLILPFKATPNIKLFVEPNSTDATVLSGYIGGNGSFITQFPLLDVESVYYLTLNNVQFPINQASDSDVFGFYNFSFYEISGNIADYENSLIYLRSIRIKDSSILRTHPNAVQESDKNTLSFDFANAPYKISAYLSKQTNTNTDVNLIVGISTIILIIISAPFFAYKLEELNNTLQNLFFAIVIIIILIQIGFFCFYIYPKKYHHNLAVISAITSVFGLCVAFVIRLVMLFISRISIINSLKNIINYQKNQQKK